MLDVGNVGIFILLRIVVCRLLLAKQWPRKNILHKLIKGGKLGVHNLKEFRGLINHHLEGALSYTQDITFYN